MKNADWQKLENITSNLKVRRNWGKYTSEKMFSYKRLLCSFMRQTLKGLKLKHTISVLLQINTAKKIRI